MYYCDDSFFIYNITYDKKRKRNKSTKILVKILDLVLAHAHKDKQNTKIPVSLLIHEKILIFFLGL